MKYTIPLFLGVLLCLQSRAQEINNLPSTVATDSVRHAVDQAKAIRMGLPLLRIVDGQISEFQYFEVDGTPLYYITDNRDAGKTISTNKLYNGGGLGLDLSGDGMTIGEWDGGKALLTHVEFDGRATQIDGASKESSHATHVGITLIGKGVKAEAKGMAYKASLNAYDWNLDEGEMQQAAANGLLISNHSYGNITGWFENKNEDRWEWYGDTTLSADEDWKYGYYNFQAREWDEIAQNNPYYLIVKSAGNDRNDKLPVGKTHWLWSPGNGWVESTTARANTGPYDCISGAGNSKNVLTVGAVKAITSGYTQPSDVEMSTFSSWGPTDDGRIKPDLCGNGVGVHSGISTGNNAYATYNGTSMASPNVAGSLLLLQEHYHNLNNAYMRAATLKALAIHTTDEAGDSLGPDYSFGWGLANMASAAKVISNDTEEHQLIEESIDPNSSYELIVYSDGTKPLWATISWTDPKADISNKGLDVDDLKLINDLDMRIIRLDDNALFEPWILDPANPTHAATRGNNFRDNVEQVMLENPQAGFYKILVQSNSLQNNAAQAFGLIVSGEAAGLQADFTTPKTTVCSFNGVPFTADVLGTPDTYSWTFTGPETLNYQGENPSVLFKQPGQYAVKLVVSNPKTADSITKSSYITVQASPEYRIFPLSGTFCDNDPVAYTLTDSSGGTFSGNGVSGNEWTPSIAGAGTQWVYGSLTGGNGCVRLDSFSVEVEVAPSKPIITENQGILTSSVTTDIQWYKDGVLIPGADQASYMPTESATYRVDASNTTSCIASSDDFEYWMTSVSSVQNQKTFEIIPNPSAGNVQVKASIRVNGMIALYDAKGSLILKQQWNSNTLDLKLSSLPNGIYLIKIMDGSQGYSRKLVVQH